jgi:hypothetical protein
LGGARAPPGKTSPGRLFRPARDITRDINDGAVDILTVPAGTSGFAELAANADTLVAFDESFLVASLDDLIRMKRAAGRPKDRVELEILGALRDELDGSQ